ncbi:DUF6629 family protein [Chryseobacterium sediminis]|uniref:Uncharacterized protein n=1 Tax=Chryseobacterium sediminis TaxID=1679494 RepID=A0A5B2U8B1_9FLAO|nr:DUF6629 family protein [Chryseobacterium sediminis]KAA2222901.1 hypothetical protein FW780_01490 [Chryseobacterium sediminis]
MCFSAISSFSAGIALTAVGIACIKKTRHPSQHLFACIPFIFGVQQLTEGILWLTLPQPDHIIMQRAATFIFLFFAEILWPVWVPISLLMFEDNEPRKKVQKILLGVGIIVSIYLAYCLLSYHVEAKIMGHHITYIQNYPASLRNYSIISYGVATIAPPFFSQLKRMHFFGIAILVSYIVSEIFYDHYILSVWCFFAAIISMSVYIIVSEKTDKKQREYPEIYVK